MKKIIDGSVYNTETAKFICDIKTSEVSHIEGAVLEREKKLYRTKSSKYFFYILDKFDAWVVVNDDDIEPEFEYLPVEDEKIVPITYKIALDFSAEVIEENSEQKDTIVKFFPELADDKVKEHDIKIQKKIYISTQAEWYLEMMTTGTNETYSSFIDRLINEKYEELYRKGVMNQDPFHMFD